VGDYGYGRSSRGEEIEIGWLRCCRLTLSKMNDVYDLLYNNYVEDDEAMFRLKYSTSFLNWYDSQAQDCVEDG